MRLQSIVSFLFSFDGKRSSKAKPSDVSQRKGSGGAGPGKQPDVTGSQAAVPITAADLEAAANGISADVKSWDTGCFTHVKKLQDAVRNHGRVDMMRASSAAGNHDVAVKRMPHSWVTSGPEDFKKQYPSSPEQPWTDIAILRRLNEMGYPYVCRLSGVFRDDKETFVVTALASEGDLFTWCDGQAKPGPEREQSMRYIACQFFAAVQWLHDLNIAHRDLSLENILLTDVGGGEMRVKIIDFGMATLSRSCRREVRGKQSYQAPEMHGDPAYDPFQADVFALGVTLFAMAAQDYPWTSTKRNTCQLNEYVCMFGFRKFLEKRKLRRGNGEHLIQVFSPPLIDLLEGLLHRSVDKRLTLGETCFKKAATGKDRSTVWDGRWLEGVKPPFEAGAPSVSV